MQSSILQPKTRVSTAIRARSTSPLGSKGSGRPRPLNRAKLRVSSKWSREGIRNLHNLGQGMGAVPRRLLRPCDPERHPAAVGRLLAILLEDAASRRGGAPTGPGRRSGGQASWLGHQERVTALLVLPAASAGKRSFRPTFLLGPRKDGGSLARSDCPSWLSTWL